MHHPNAEPVTVAQLDTFEEVIDVRAPSEYIEDHIPGALSCPVLSDDERALVGTLHKQASAFDAKRRGAVLVARNIADHIEQKFATRPTHWRPLIYCWRGGKRSRAMALIFREIGWRAAQLESGYKAYRRAVVDDLTRLPTEQHFVVVCGETGSATSKLLTALHDRGAQVLDLEAIAQHRGSVLGDLPESPQPAQKWFESQLWHALRRFSGSAPIFVESESKKIGQLQVPDALIAAMRASQCIRLDVPIDERARYLINEYAHFVTNPDALAAKLEHLRPLHGATVIDRWRAQTTANEWPVFVADMLAHHYDPAYRRSMARNFAQLGEAAVIAPTRLDADGIGAAADATLAAVASGSASRLAM